MQPQTRRAAVTGTRAIPERGRSAASLDAAVTAPLFTPITIGNVALRNRVVVSPMCQYSSPDGFATDWHLVHLGSRAVGGSALVIAEATAVTPEGRISPWDLGIWKDAHIPALARCTRFITDQGAVAGIQLGHAGRKASTRRPWDGHGQISPDEGGWIPVAPSATPFADGDVTPHALSVPEIRDIVHAFGAAAQRAVDAGFRVLEIHAAHGYLLHEFLSPLSNTRADEYGGSFENRTRLTREVVSAIRDVAPDNVAVWIRISATDWVPDGWDVEESIELARMVASLGVTLVDCSTGGLVPRAKIPVRPGYQVEFARRIRHEAGVATGAVGLITSPEQANHIIADGDADVVLLARQLLRDPYWPLHAARALGTAIEWPVQYERARD